MPRWFFRADRDNRLEHVVAAWTVACTIRSMECVPVAFVQSTSWHVEQPDADQARTICRPASAQSFSQLVSVRRSCGARSHRGQASGRPECRTALCSTSSFRRRQTFSPANREGGGQIDIEGVARMSALATAAAHRVRASQKRGYNRLSCHYPRSRTPIFLEFVRQPPCSVG